MPATKKRRAPDDNQDDDQNLPSPALSSKTATPKRPRLKPTLLSSTPSHLDITKSLTKTLIKTPLTPHTPSKKPSRKQLLATDPINVSIYDLRKEGRGWDDIATRTNEACVLSERDELTPAACYSRFFRNGPLVAKEKGEDYAKEWYVHMKGSLVRAHDEDVEEEGGEEMETEEKVVLEAVEKVKAEFWTNVVKVVNEGLEGGKVMSEEDVKAVYDRASENVKD